MQKKHLRLRLMSVFLSIVMCLQMSELSIFAMETYDPALQIDLSVPVELQDGNNYFFIGKSGYTIGEKSREKQYIPVQRTGNLEEEAEVTVKVVDLTARNGENYQLKIADERIRPELVYGGKAVIDLIQDGYDQQEVETMDENQFAESVYEAGGAELMDADENPVGLFKTYPLDENGNRIADEAAGDDSGNAADEEAVLHEDNGTGIEAAEESGETESSGSQPAETGDTGMAPLESVQTAIEKDPDTKKPEVNTYTPSGEGVEALKEARNAYTGTVSDRQEMSSSENLVSQMTGGLMDADADTGDGQEQENIELASDDYPGREYLLHFDAGEEARFLVLTPEYSEKSDGNGELMIMLKNPSENTPVSEGFFMTHVTILDEDEPEPVTVSMAEEQVTAENGIASIKVIREGRINSIVGVNIASWDGTAAVNDDYGGVDAKLYFPMGITERTIELPVGQGVSEKDFSVTITPVTECSVGLATTHVIIPALDTDGSAELMATNDNSIYADPWNLKNIKQKWTGKSTEFRYDDYGVYLRTKNDSHSSAYLEITPPHGDGSSGYAYDGIHMEYDFFTNWADGKVWIDRKPTTESKDEYETLKEKKHGDCSMIHDKSMDAYYGTPESPATIGLNTKNYDNHYSGVRDCHVKLWVKSVQPIKRKFDIIIENPESLDFIGMDKLPKGAVNPYERFMVNKSLDTSFTIQTWDSFSISPIENADSPRYTRLVGIDAVKNGKTLRVVTLDGTSETPNVTLDHATINKLARNDFIEWKTNKDGSVKGTIRFRPVFDYKDVTIEVKDSQYGSFKAANLSPGTHEKTFHMGDKLTLETDMSAAGERAGLSPSGFDWISQKAKNGDYLHKGSPKYINGSETLTLSDPYYILEPTFTETDNQVVVQVSENDLQYFDESQGLFATDNKWKDGDAWSYLIEKSVPANQVVEIQAYPKDAEHVPTWTTTQDQLKYSGQSFYIRTAPEASDNVVTLTVNRSASSHAWYQMSGSVYVTTRNLSTGYEVKAQENTDDDADVQETVNAAKGAIVAAGRAGSITDESGSFTLVPQYLTGGTTLRYTITYNGTVDIREIRLPASGVKKQSVTYDDPTNPGTDITVDAVSLSANMVDVSSYSLENTHFGSVYAVQEGQVSGVIKATSMNGKKTVFTITVEPGNPYLFEGESCTENVTDVTLFFKNQLDGAIHGVWSSSNPVEETPLKWDPETGIATLTFQKFTPEDPDLYTAGDVLYAQLTTDKKVDGNAFYSDSGSQMVYYPVSTGITVTSDLDYEPETMEYDMPLDAESLMASLQDEQRATYGKFPFLGEITFAVSVLSPIKSYTGSDSDISNIFSDLMNDDSDTGDYDVNVVDENNNPVNTGDSVQDLPANSYYQSDGYSRSRWNFNIAMKVAETQYGGTRFMLAIVANLGGGGSGYQSQVNPYESKTYFNDLMNNTLTETKDQFIGKSAKKNNRFADAVKQAHAGGPYYKFQIYFGLYLDFGYIEITSTDDSGKTEMSHDMVFMGGGGFFGASATVGVTYPFWCVVFPAYFNFEGTAKLTVFAGISPDPNQTLAAYNNEKQHDFTSSWDWTLDVIVEANAGVTIGAGLYKVAGIRCTASFGVEVDYSRKIPEWYPDVDFGMGGNWGYGTMISFSGTIDLVFVSIPLWSYSWDGPWGDGFVKYFREVRKGNVLIRLIEKNVADGDGSAEAREECTRRAEILKAHIDAMDLSTGDLKKEVNSLRSYAYDKHILNYAEYDRSKMIAVAGIAGAISDAVMMEDEEDQSIPLSGNTTDAFYVQDHVNSEWVAGSGELMSTFEPVSSQTLEENAYHQPGSQILNIGADKLLMVFLDDRGSGDKTQSAVMKYTVYDAKTGTWTEPAVVQDDVTGDSNPNLIHATPDYAILSWSSITDGKYQALRDTVRAELKEKNGSDPSESDIDAALEKDSARVLSQMDIFTVKFDKIDCTFGEIEQLTDDNLYDDYPQAVYDTDSGDYIVLYSKTAQNRDKYTDNESQTAEEQALLDMVNPYAADNTYSVMCYMLYNCQTDAADTNGNTHERGWARDYLFPNEMSLDEAGQQNFLEKWKGQRFLSTPVSQEKDGKIVQVDPPIVDLATCRADNGLGVYAYTVDMDFDLDTFNDKALYVQYYDFKNHMTEVPVRVAGPEEKAKLVKPEDKYASGAGFVTTTEQVEVGMPKMVRDMNSNTWLFWRQNNNGLRYLNVTELAGAKVATGEGEAEWTYAIREDGTFATDAVTGQTYEPEVQTVDFGSPVSDREMNITEYQILNDKNDNLYVVYTDTTTYSETDPVLGTPVQGTALEVYATAKIPDDEMIAGSKDGDPTDAEAPASWSKPNRLTKNNRYNDGIAIVQGLDGELYMIHNQYNIEDKHGDLEYLESHGMLTFGEDGEVHLSGDPYVRSPISLMATRLTESGSIEVSDFTVSDETPQGGETITVSAMIANNGLTSADGYVVDFYEYKDDQAGRKIETLKSDEMIPVNNGEMVSFKWKVPEEGVDGYSIQAVVKEKKLIGYHEVEEYYSPKFEQVPEYEIAFDSVKQNGDVFDVSYTVTNTGNKAFEDGIEAQLTLSALHGDLKEVYGMDDPVLLKTDLSGLKPGKTKTVSESVTIPVSVFKFCGYDAVKVNITTADDNILKQTGSKTISLDEPMNLRLNGGEDMTLAADEEKAAALTYDTTVFLKTVDVVYSVEDNSVADVDTEGNVTAMGPGTTTLTATLLPSGRNTSVKVTVQGGESNGGSSGGGTVTAGHKVTLPDTVSYGSASASAKQAKAGEQVTITVTPEEGYQTAAVNVIDENGNAVEVTDNGDGTYTFTMPDTAVTVTPVFVKEGGSTCPRDDSCPMTPFTDADKQAWYHDGVHWAIEKGIMNGTGENTFEPLTSTSRAMIVTMLWRMEGSPQVDDNMTFKDVPDSQWYTDAVRWAEANGIVNGYSEDAFGPDDKVIREQIVTILYRYAQFKGMDVSKSETAYLNDYTDAKDISEWAVKAFRWAVDAGVIQGMTETTLSPKGDAVRAQVATILMRFSEKIQAQ